jgi:hypothetical protein
LPEFNCEQRVFSPQPGGINEYRKHTASSLYRGAAGICLRLAMAWLETRWGARTGGVFCSGRIKRTEARFLMGNEDPSEGDKPIC